MCCAPRKSPRSSSKRESLSTASSEDLYTATPPKRARRTCTENDSLYPDPLQLRKKLEAGSLEVTTKNFDQAPRRGPNRCHSTRFTKCRRNSVGAVAELEGEPVRPATRSSSCSSLPRYESVMVNSRRIRPSRYHRQHGSRANTFLGQHSPRSLDEHSRAASTSVVQSAFEKTPAVIRLPSTPAIMRRQAADEALKLVKPGHDRLRVKFAIRVSDRTWFERDKEDTTAAILDQERIRCVNF